MMKKKWLNLALISTFVLSAAGCGAPAAKPTGGDSKPSPDTKPAVSAPSGNATNTDKKLTGDFEIQYFVGGYGDAWWKEMIAEFQKKYPDLKIKESAGAKINDQMKPRWIQGNPPDFVYIDGAGANARQMVKDDQLMDITDWLKDLKNADGEKLSDLLISKPEEYEAGKNHTVPLVFGSWGTFYDKALFTKNGWEEPKDFPSFLAVADKIKASGMTPYIHTGVYPYYIAGGLLDSATVSANKDDASILKKVASLEPGIFKSEPVMKALDKIVQLRDKGLIDPGSVSLNHTDSQALWLQHKAAFIPNGLWLENEMKKDIPQGFDFGFIPSVSQDKGGKYIAIPYTSTIAVAKKAKNPDAAKAFIQFLFTKQHAVRWAELTGALMNVKADLDSSKASNVVKSAMKYYNSSNTVVAPEVVLPADVEKARNDAIVALTTSKITPAEWADRMEKAAEKARASK
ncbi:extracellular solute-binding protein [Paenibacillus sp. UNC451MF]|uniref:extracellular solute-binding protein n=1 Tax=Paenibacillus sp. UNC451MF TaxID=1449063 RepID=UPI00048E8A0D|nr:extracellular solute-binding protein [Paenibacillus sp. UNC451MF]